MKNFYSFCFLLIAFFSFSIDFYWTGTNGNDWHEQLNWSIGDGTDGNDGVPNNGDNVFLTTAGTVIASSPIDVNSITIDDPDMDFTANDNVSVMLDFAIHNGDCTVGSSSLSVGNDFTLSNGSYTATTATVTVGNNYSISGGI